MTRVSVLVVAAGFVGSAAGGVNLLIDLGSDNSFRGASVPGTIDPGGSTGDAPGVDAKGDTWNSVWSGDFYSGLWDIDGVRTGVNFGFSAAPGTDYFNGPSGSTADPAASVYDAVALGDLAADEAVYDYYVNSQVQIQGLDPTKAYELRLYGSHKFNNDNTTRYTVYTDGNLDTVVDSVDLLVGVNSAHNQDTVASLTVNPAANGIIYLGWAGANGGSGYLNALQVIEIPAPGSVALVGAAGLVAARRRRA